MPGVNEGITLGQLYEALIPFYSKDSKLFELVGPGDELTPSLGGRRWEGRRPGRRGRWCNCCPNRFWRRTQPSRRRPPNLEAVTPMGGGWVLHDHLWIICLPPERACSSVNLETSSRFILNVVSILKLKQDMSFLGFVHHTEYAAS